MQKLGRWTEYVLQTLLKNKIVVSCFDKLRGKLEKYWQEKSTKIKQLRLIEILNIIKSNSYKKHKLIKQKNLSIKSTNKND